MYTENSNDTTYVKNLNEQLQSITEANNTKFIKVNHELSNAGKLLPQYSSDGLHLNNAGYSALLKEIRTQTLQFISTELKQCRD